MEAAAVTAAVELDEIGQKAGPLGTTGENDLVVVDGEPPFQAALQQLMDEAGVVRTPETRSPAADAGADQGPLAEREVLGHREGGPRHDDRQAEVEGLLDHSPLHLADILGRSVIIAVKEEIDAARAAQVPSRS